MFIFKQVKINNNIKFYYSLLLKIGIIELVKSLSSKYYSNSCCGFQLFGHKRHKIVNNVITLMRKVLVSVGKVLFITQRVPNVCVCEVKPADHVTGKSIISLCVCCMVMGLYSNTV